MPVVPRNIFVLPIYEAISTRACRNLEADYFALIIVDPVRLDCELYISKKIDPELVLKLKKLLRKEAPKSWVLDKQKQSSTFPGCNGDSMKHLIGQIFSETLKCQKILFIPFEIEGIGGGYLIWCWQNEPVNFSKVYYEKASLITEQVALSLKLSLKERKSQELNAKLAALLELSTAIYSSLNYKEVLEKAVHLSMGIVGADGGSIFILDKKTNLLKPLITIDEKHEEEISKINLRLGEGITGLVARNGIGVISNHSESDPRAFQVPGTPKEPESLISAPLTWSGEVIGTITLRSTTGKQFIQEDLDILTIFARQTADAIENAKLFESLKKAYKELSNTQEQFIMTEKLRALGEMAGGVAHDFNNVLGAILGRTQLLLRKIEDPKWVEHLKLIEKVTLSGAKTVQKLQNFTRVSRQSQFEHVDLTKVIEDAIEMTRPRWKDECQRQGIVINLSLKRNKLQPILGNPNELVEAISNLILNAVDALPEGGIIEIVTMMKDDRVLVNVKDNGVGMNESVLKRIFFPFFTTKGMQGTGMGLAVVYGIITRHKGDIDVSSKVGQGTEVMLSFPSTGESISKIEPLTRVIGEREAKILIIDDDDNIREVVCEILEVLGHKVKSTSTGEEGIKLYKEEKFDLVITDLGMPGMSGWEVTRVCKSLKPSVPVMMISGWGNQIDEEMVNQSKLDGVLAKPFEIIKIKNMVQNVLAKSLQASADTPAET